MTHTDQTQMCDRYVIESHDTEFDDSLGIPSLTISLSFDDDDSSHVTVPHKHSSSVEKTRQRRVFANVLLATTALLELFSCYNTIIRENIELLFLPKALTPKVIHFVFTALLTLTSAWNTAYSMIGYLSKKKYEQRKIEKTKNASVTVRRRQQSRVVTKQLGLQPILLFTITLFLRLSSIPFFQKNGRIDLLLQSFTSIIIPSKRIGSSGNQSCTTIIQSTRFLSLIELLFINITMVLRELIIKNVQRKAKTLAIWFSKRVASLAIRHPFLTHMRLQQLFKVIRWAKYLGPIIGACNKLKGHIEDGIAKWKQKRKKRRAQRTWENLVATLQQNQRLELAVRKIQYSFRRRKREKVERRLRFMHLTADHRKRRAAEVYKRIEQRWEREFDIAHKGIELAEEVEQQRLQKRSVKESDKKLILERAQKLGVKNKLLLRPNTAFSVVWKMIAISCVAIEISMLVLTPRVKKMQQISLLELYKSLRTCHGDHRRQCQQEKSNNWKLWTLIPFLIHTAETRNSSRVCTEADMLSYSDILIGISYGLMEHANPFVSSISFLDVFVTFFTGEYDGANLRPKSFFSRWIFPGIVLQLIVNPTMHRISAFLRFFRDFALAAGPLRILYIIRTLNRPVSE